MKRFAQNGVLLLLSLAACTSQIRACAWDRDTLETEAKGIPDTVRIVVGAL